MSARYAPFAPILATLLAALPTALSAQLWEKIDELPGGIAVELDQDSVFESLDGARLVLNGTFRRENVGWMMESNVAIDCELERAKIRGMRLMDGAEVMTERTDHLAEFVPINPGSMESLYFRALCGKEASTEAALPEASEEDAGIDLPPGEEAIAEGGVDMPPAEEEPEFGELFGEVPPEDASSGDTPE